MEPENKQSFTNEKIISMMRVTKKTDPLFKPLKKLKHAIQNVGFDKISSTPTNKLLLFHFGLGNALDKNIILQTSPFSNQQQQKSFNPILPGKSFCVLDFQNTEKCMEYFEREYLSIMEEMPSVRYREVRYENLTRILVCMYCVGNYMVMGENMEIPDCSEKYEGSIPGMHVIEDFINKEEEIQLLSAIDKGQWQRLNNRRVQHFGYEFKYGRNQIDKDEQYKFEMPQFIKQILLKLAHLQIIPKDTVNYDQMTINDYFSGDGIPPHFDTHSPFEEYFVAISMLSGIVMEWRKYDGTEQQIYLKQRSLVIFSGEGRYAWTHGISCRKMDKIEGQLRHRARRISITLRKIRRQPCICPYYFYCDSQGYNQTTMKKHNPLLKKYLSQKSKQKLTEQPSQIYQKYVVQAYNGFGYNFHNKIIPMMKQTLLEYLKQRKQGTLMLDVGCGNGQYYEIVEQIEKVGYIAIEYCQVMGACENLVHMNGLKMGFRKQVFDVVICVAVLHHLTTPKQRSQMLLEIYNALNETGYVFITCFSYENKKQIYSDQDIILEYCVPNHKLKTQDEGTQIKKQNHRKQLRGQIYQRYYHLFKEEELVELMEGVGFSIVEIKKDHENILVVAKKS